MSNNTTTTTAGNSSIVNTSSTISPTQDRNLVNAIDNLTTGNTAASVGNSDKGNAAGGGAADAPRSRGNSGRFRFSFKRKTQRAQLKEELREKCTFLSQEEVHVLDQELTTEYGFTWNQIHEHGGLAGALALQKAYPKESLSRDGAILVCCGPGHNGAFGMVLARYVKVFGYKVTVYCPKATHKDLLSYCERLNIPSLSYLSSEVSLLNHNYSLIVDAIFGHSFEAPVRNDMADVLLKLKECSVPILSLDLPSGWEAEKADTDSLKPETLVSLFLPKKSSLEFSGKKHYIAGKIIPNSLAKRQNWKLVGYSPGELVMTLFNQCSDSGQLENEQNDAHEK